MPLEVQLNKGESQDSLLRRFQRMVQVSGILREAKANLHFVSKRDAARLKAKIVPVLSFRTGEICDYYELQGHRQRTTVRIWSRRNDVEVTRQYSDYRP